ncbi:hypothetical protein E1A91_A10G117300v1, partial [Gossypium mustelinum]
KTPKGCGFFFYQLEPPFTPWGCSTGFMTTPLTIRRLLSQHLDPTLSKLFRFTPTIPTCLTIVEQVLDIKQTSPKCNFNMVYLFSFVISFITASTAPANCPPLPSVIFMLCMVVPKGISVEGHFWFCRCLKQICLLHITISLESIILYEELLM